MDPTAVPQRMGAEWTRLAEEAARTRYWSRFGTYLAERQWGTVREDYSKDGESWDYFTHDDAPRRAYRFGEDGLLGLCDRRGRLCFAPALWNGKDPLLKERLFGLANREGNHGEDVKEVYDYQDALPSQAYARALYRYPIAAFPYEELRRENGKRSRLEREYEITDTRAFDDGFVELIVEYAKESPEDVLVRLTLRSASPRAATIHLLAQLWFANHWSWGRTGEGHGPRPEMRLAAEDEVVTSHHSLGEHRLMAVADGTRAAPRILFCENETNRQALFGASNESKTVKDGFHQFIVHGQKDAVASDDRGTKAAAWWVLDLAPGEEVVVRLQLSEAKQGAAPARLDAAAIDRVFATRIAEADEFYRDVLPGAASDEERRIARLAYAGLIWSKQYYHYAVREWLEGDPAQPAPPKERVEGRNRDWPHLYNRDVLLVPDKWEYPWYAAWDTAFHCVALAKVDVDFAKAQLELFLREWYMHPSGQIPAYEYELGDVNPPVHAFAVWRVYKSSGPKGQRDRAFLERCFHKLLLNFTWWVNRKDVEGNHLFAGGFLGLDNIGVFDRSKPVLGDARLEQADGTAWMAFYCGTMLAMALELARTNGAYEDLASKFFEHYVHVAHAMNTVDGSGLFDETDGFYYDRVLSADRHVPLRVRSLVGLVPLFSVEVIEGDVFDRFPGFVKRTRWFLREYDHLARQISYLEQSGKGKRCLLAIPSRDRLTRVLRRVLDENEFLSPHGIRSLSRHHAARPFELALAGEVLRVSYAPGESESGMFGGNSNWRGPVWMPMNYLLIEALERWHYFYGDSFRIECPTGSGRMLDLKAVSREIGRRVVSLFLPGPGGVRPCVGSTGAAVLDGLLPFHEYFHGDTGEGLGASHQTGWTALVARLIEKQAKDRG
jgi:hypothetical protein